MDGGSLLASARTGVTSLNHPAPGCDDGSGYDLVAFGVLGFYQPDMGPVGPVIIAVAEGQGEVLPVSAVGDAVEVP